MWYKTQRKIGEKMEFEIEKKKSQKSFLGGIITGLSIGFVGMVMVFLLSRVFMGGNFSSPLATPAVEQSTTDEKSVISPEVFSKIALLEQAIDIYSFYDINQTTLADGLYKGLIASIDDPYSTYYTKEEFASIMEQTEGVYYGVGAYIGYDKKLDYPVFSKIMVGTPAEEAGLRKDDIIFAVNGESCFEMETADVAALVKGPEGTTVVITVYRQLEDAYVDIEVTRKKIETPTVTYKMLENNIGYIEISEFDEITISQFEAAKEALDAEKMEALIIDLRSNPGGNLSAVNEIARQILPKGLIVYTESKDGQREDYSCDGLHELKIPLVVLTNENSASASEILAGAVKDYKIGTLVGETTFGKGIVQRIISLGDDTAVKLTISEYFTPNGINIHGIGIVPDVEVPFDMEAYTADGTDSQLNKGIEVIEQKLNITQ